MKHPRHLPLRKKVMLVALFSTGAALAAAAIAFYAFQLFHFRRDFVRNTAVLAEVVANNSTAAVAFSDADAANETLALVRARPDILQATIELTNGETFAHHGHTNRYAGTDLQFTEGPHFQGDFLYYTQPIHFNGKLLGRLRLVSNFGEVYQESVRIYVGILAAVLACCGLLAFLLAARLARVITDPVLRLTYMARTVSECQNYSVRADYDAGDELGVLARTFNQMLDRVHESSAMMQNQIAERTLAAAELRESKERAEAASQAKSQFLANMSHEIRTPLGGVLGMLHLLQKTSLQPQQTRYVANARGAAQALLAVIGDILDFSRIEAGKLELESAVFAPRDLLQQTVTLFAERAERQKLELLSRIDREVPGEVVGDPNRLRQILINLLGNALKFTQRGHVTVTCTVESRTATEVVLRFAVNDSGCGIPVSQQEHVFDAFSQADNSMTRVHGGTGLGLAISRQLCALMGGNISLQSVPDVGSTFAFTVQLKRHPPGVMSDASPVGARVFVIDDVAASREFLTAQICARQGEVEAAADFPSASEQLREAAQGGTPFDVVLVDWSLTDPDALATARAIRTDVTLGQPRLVLLNRFSPAGELENWQQAGFAASISKPVTEAELFAAIRTAANSDDPSGILPASSNIKAPPPAPSPMGLTTVLVVEDNAINQEVASEMLRELGYRCVCAGNGRVAVETIQRERPHLVLMDCQMPVLDGYEAARVIRQWEEANGLSRLPIVALTAHALKGDRERCLAAGMDDYLAKPLDPDVLVAALTRWLGPLSTTLPAIGETVSGVAMVAATVVDLEDLLARCGGRQEFADRLLRKFIRQAEDDLLEIAAAIVRQEGHAISAAAHRLRSSAVNVSARGLDGLASELDRVARSGVLTGTQLLHEQLQAQLQEVREFVTRTAAAPPVTAPAP